MNILSLRFLLTASVSAILLFFANHKQVVAQAQVEVPTADENSGEMVVDANCNTENGECLNPDAETSTTTTTTVTAASEDPNCPSREHVIRCAGLHLDTNKNGYLERKELQDAIDRLPWYGRGKLQCNPEEHGEADFSCHCVFSH